MEAARGVAHVVLDGNHPLGNHAQRVKGSAIELGGPPAETIGYKRIRQADSPVVQTLSIELSSDGGDSELVVDGESGIVVPPRDAPAIAAAIETLYRDEELRLRMGEAARERIGVAFRNEDTVRNTIALYEELVPDPD